MKSKISFLVLLILFIFLASSIHVSARTASEQLISDTTNLSSSKQERYILNTHATEQSTILYEQISWRGLKVKGNLNQTLSFNYNESISDSYSFSWAIGVSVEGGVSIPFVADAKVAVQNTFTNQWSETDTFSHGVTITQIISDPSDVGYYEMLMYIPQTKLTEISSDWTRQTRTRSRVLGFLWWGSWGEWKDDSDFDGGTDQNYYTFSNSIQISKPYLVVELVEQTSTSSDDSSGSSGGSSGSGGSGGSGINFLEQS
ncbi:MAG: hypothetical protein RBT45_05275 [Acholeplasmataceae bacterium]|jgi:hypothetical protein|nr:hypothetical protein [Acholeplasmataceae bacterium]